MGNLCFLFFLVFLFLLSIILFAWILSNRIINQEIENVDNTTRDQLGRLISENYRVDDFSQVYPIEIDPEEITIVSWSVDPERTRSWTDFTRKRLEEYTSYHGYKLRYFTEVINKRAPILWQKIYAVQKALQEPTCQAVMWVDDDIIITSPQRSVQDFMSMTEKPMIFSEDIGDKPNQEPLHKPEYYWNVMNAGIFILRKTPETMAFLEDVIKGREELFGGFWNKQHYHDQSVMSYYLYTKYLDNFALMPLGYLQSIYKTSTWRPEHFSLHLAGETKATRYRVIKKVLENTASLCFSNINSNF